MLQFDVDLTRAAELGDGILAELDTLRESDPIHWSEASRCWIITRHADVVEGFSGRLPLLSRQFPAVLNHVLPPEEQKRLLPNCLRYVSRFATNLDAPEHPPVRKLLVKAFNKKIVENLRPYVRERVNQLLDKAQDGQPIEFSEEIARQLPGAVILRLMGLPDSYLQQLQVWDDAIVGGLASNQPQLDWLLEMERCVAEMADIFKFELEKRRREPSQDIMTELLNAMDDGDEVGSDQLIGILQVLTIAGNESTTSSLKFALVLLARQPEQWSYLRQNPDKALAAVIEMTRVSAMSSSFPRLAAQDFEWHGKQLRKGDLVMLMVASGNRDPRVYDDPLKFNPERSNDAILTFGPGLHHCIGHLLAKMQMEEFFTSLVNRFEGVEILNEPIQFGPSIVFRAFKELHVRLQPRA